MALFIVWWICAGGAWAVEMIAHPGVTVQILTVNETRSIFGMRQLTWPGGVPVRVFVLPEQHSLHASFCREMLNIYPYQLRLSWNRLVYSGTGQAPTEVATEQEMLARVASTPGAIGYVNKVNSNDSVHTVSVR
ncbi:MAG: hypothetical protein Q7U78_04380 [Gallionella sp.]|nr:hypothetical protein [Gallionella sp.]